MKKSHVVAAIMILAALLWTAPPGPGAQVPEDEQVGRLVDQMEGINRSLGKLVILLERSLDNQQVDVLLKRIDLKDRRLVPLEAELRKAEREVEEHDGWFRHMREEKEQLEERLREANRDGNAEDARIAREMLDQVARVVEEQQNQAGTLRDRVRRLEDTLAAGREDLEVLEEMLRDRLE